MGNYQVIGEACKRVFTAAQYAVLKDIKEHSGSAGRDMESVPKPEGIAMTTFLVNSMRLT